MRGFTLVEALVTTVIIGIVLTLSVAEFSQVARHYSKTTGDLQAEVEARNAMASVTKELRQAMSNPNVVATPPPVLQPTPGPSPTSMVQFTEAENIPGADYTTMKFDTITIAPKGTPPPGHTYPNLVLTRDNGVTATDSVIGQDIKFFSVTGVYKSVYDVQITTAPPMRPDMPVKDFTLNTRVFISYYKTNS